ncbi:MAG: hypothetical protein IJP92_05810 [Lachnospiraceae bacterium]|nr:hypothetical protein [Lachnospiraceae bacterium]
MKTFVKGFCAAVLGIAFFIAVLVAWIELTNPDRGSAADASATTGNAATAAQGAGGAQTGTGTGGGSGTGTGTGTPQGNAGGAQGAGGASAATSEPVSYANAAASREQAMLDFLAIIEPELKEEFGDNVTIERNGMNIRISFWVDDLIKNLSDAQIDDTTMDLWVSTQEKADALCTTYYNQLSGFGVSDAHIAVNLLNDRDRDKIILSYEDGRLVHDGLPQTHFQTQMDRYEDTSTSGTTAATTSGTGTTAGTGTSN